ncbi:UNVERIFIED_CONTAM: hypothetical protein HDU68_002287 [Siphonaria sp. JEL0065]|nr:hypothetical protein HDU68_002287 [Siphonaria sp. JEL0065]
MQKKDLAKLTKKELLRIVSENGWTMIDVALKKELLIQAIANLSTENSEQNDGEDSIEEEERDTKLKDLTRPELVKLAKSLNLKTTGKKGELLERILAAQQLLVAHAPVNLVPESAETKTGEPHQVTQAKMDAQMKAANYVGAVGTEPPQEIPQENSFFCCIDRTVFREMSVPGLAVLKSGLVVILDKTSELEHPLRLPIQQKNGSLPDGMTDNIVCRSCVDRNKASNASRATSGRFNAMTPIEPLNQFHAHSLSDSFSFSFHTPLTSTPLEQSPAKPDSSSASPPNVPPQKEILSEIVPSNDDNNEFLDELSIISATADEVLAVLNESEPPPTSTCILSNIPTSSSPSSVPISTINKRLSMAPSPQKATSNNTHRKSIKQPLSIALAQRRMSAKIMNSKTSQLAREKKVAEIRGIQQSMALDQFEEEHDPNTSRNSLAVGDVSFSSTVSGKSNSTGSLKLPAPPKERKARGEVLWKQPSRPASVLETAYIPKEDKQIAQAVDSILESTERGSMEEWNMIAGRGSSGIRRSP